MLISSVIRPVIGSVIGSVVGGLRPVIDSSLVSWMRADAPFTITADINDLVQSIESSNNLVENTLESEGGTTEPKVGLLNNNQPTIQFLHDGTNLSYLEVADNPSLKYTRFTAFSVFEVDVLNRTHTIISKYRTSGDLREFQLGVSSTNRLFMSISTAGTSATNTAYVPLGINITANTIFIAWWRYDGVNLTISLHDGDPKNQAYTGVIFQGASRYQVGTREIALDGINGNISEAMFYTRALSDVEIAQNIKWLERWLIAGAEP